VRERPVELALDRAGGDAEDAGDLRFRQIRPEPQHDDGSLPGAQVTQQSPDLVPIGDAIDDVPAVSDVEQLRDRNFPASDPAPDGDVRTGDDRTDVRVGPGTGDR